MRETQNKRLWAYLLKYGKITAFEMFEKLHICHPPARIRDLREKYGYDAIPDRWIENLFRLMMTAKSGLLNSDSKSISYRRIRDVN